MGWQLKEALKTFIIVALTMTVAVLVLYQRGATGGGIKFPTDYSQCYRAAKKDGRPFLVLISMSHQACPPCADLANDAQYGVPMLKRVPHFVIVKLEKNPDLVKRLAGEDVVTPTLLVYQYRKKKWVGWKYAGLDEARGFTKKYVWPVFGKKEGKR